jgi:hypothetical protein
VKCHGSGQIPLTITPRQYVTADIWEVMRAADLADKGLGWPQGGGWLDQPAALVEAVRVVWDLEREHKAKRR